MVSLTVCLCGLTDGLSLCGVCLCGLRDAGADGRQSSAAVHGGLPGQQSGLQPGLAEHGLHAVAELAAEHVVDEEVDGGVDVDAELLNVDEQVVGVVVLAAGAELWLKGQYSSDEERRRRASDEQYGSADQHPGQGHVLGGATRTGSGGGGGGGGLLAPLRHAPQLDDGDDGGDDNSYHVHTWQQYTEDDAVKHVH